MVTYDNRSDISKDVGVIVMGWKYEEKYIDEDYTQSTYLDGDKLYFRKQWNPAVDARDMLKMISHMRNGEEQYNTTIHFDDCGWVRVNIFVDYDSITMGVSAGEIKADENPCVAVCLAALRAFGHECEWKSTR